MAPTPALTVREKLSYYNIKLPQAVRQRLAGSGFDQLFDIGFRLKTHNKLLDYLYDQYDKETKKFVFNNLELYFGLEDVLYMTGLAIDGWPVVVQSDRKIDNAMCKELIGLELQNNKLRFSRLSQHVRQCCAREDYNDHEIDQICRAVALLGISTIIEQDNGVGEVDVSWLSILQVVEDIPKYSWGGACWVNLHRGFPQPTTSGNTSENRTLYGCVFALEMWLLLRIPSLMGKLYGRNRLELNATSFPLMTACAKEIGQKTILDMKHHHGDRSEFLEFFQGLQCEDVEWQVYRDVVLPDRFKSQLPISRLITTVISRKFKAKHDPTVSLRQLPKRCHSPPRTSPQLSTPASEMVIPNAQDTYKKECEEKDVAIKELSKRVEELEDIIRRKDSIITNSRKAMTALEHKVVSLTRMRRRLYSGAKIEKKHFPVMMENPIYYLDSPTSPVSSDPKCSSKKQNKEVNSMSTPVQITHSIREYEYVTIRRRQPAPTGIPSTSLKMNVVTSSRITAMSASACLRNSRRRNENVSKATASSKRWRF